MSFGTTPSTMTVDPTPPGLRPMQNQLVQMLMSRLSGQGRASVPTYGSNMPNIQQQLYGMNPRTPPMQQYGGGQNTPHPGQGQSTITPPFGPANVPPTIPGRTENGTWQPPQLPRYGGIGDPPPGLGGTLSIPQAGPPVLYSPGEYTGPTGYQNAQGQWVTPQQVAPPPGVQIGDQMPMFGDITRGGPIGSTQGASNPWMIPMYGSIPNGSGLIRAMQNPYGSY